MSDSSHAPLAPSAAHRWMYCPASVQAEKGLPDISGREAKEGSAMHEVRARCLRGNRDPMDFEGWVFFGGTRTATLANAKRLNHLYPGIERLRDLCGDIGDLCETGGLVVREDGFALVEEKLMFRDSALTDVYGTLDFGAYLPDDATVVISDLKFGQGHPVYAENNDQQLIYADMFLDDLPDGSRVNEICIIIDQPRIRDAGGEWIVSLDYLKQWRQEKLLPAVEATKARNPKFVPGIKQCFWCKAKPTCGAYADFNIKNLGITFDDERDKAVISSVGIDRMSPERRAYLALHKGMLEKFLDLVHNTVLTGALTGDPTPGLKAILGNQGKRQWEDAVAAEAKLLTLLPAKDCYKTELISPTAAAEALPRDKMKLLEEFIKREPAKPQLVTLDNKKPAIEPIKMDDETAKGE